MDPTDLEMEVGSTMAVPMYAFGDDGKPLLIVKASFKSSKPKIAKVDATGLITAVKRGKTTISATADGHTAHASLRVE
jgi:hypothetical protein